MIKEKYEQFLQRFDEAPHLKYFHIEDFPNLKREGFTFMSKENRINGFFYFYDGYIEDKLVIFCHGIGGGHSSYMKEIDMLAKHGYKVLAYDNTGCCLSEGENIGAFGQSLVDLSLAIQVLKKDYHFKHIYVVGHSWGGYAASNINNFRHVDKVVAISPFISLKREYRDLFKILSPFIIKKVMKLEYQINGDYAFSNAIDALNKKDTKALIITSKDDNVINFKHHTGLMMKKVHNPNVEFLIYEDKMHNPMWTKEGVRYYNEEFGTFNKLVKEGKLKTLEEKKAYFADVDFIFMTTQDENVWSKIYQFLDK